MREDAQGRAQPNNPPDPEGRVLTPPCPTARRPCRAGRRRATVSARGTRGQRGKRGAETGPRNVASASYVLGAAPYVLVVNALGASGEPVVLSGPILDEWTRSYKTTSRSVPILDDQSRAKMAVRVSAADYRAATVGDRFSRTSLGGRLGLLYRWTFGPGASGAPATPSR